MRGLDFIRNQWTEGARHGFPPCCRARYIVDQLRPSLLDAVLPEGVAGRVRRLTHPRFSVADGMVPCELHLVAYLATGDKTGWRNPLPATMCCQMRRDLVENGHVHLEREAFDVDGIGPVAIWMFGTTAENAISVNACPYCGKALDG